MDNIKDIFKDKNFNEQTLNLIGNFIEEFDELFGKYLPREELIKRIQNNLDKDIAFVDFENENVMGRYKKDEKRILLKNGVNDEEIKGIFFHEMIHCITNHEKFIGFPRGLSAEELMYSGDTESRFTAIGITEGFTEYVTKIRNEKFGQPINAYTILREQTENLAEVIGKDKFLEIAFNNPEKLFQVMVDENILEDEFEVDTFLGQFDIIHKFEKEILADRIMKSRGRNKDALLLDILGVRDFKKVKLEEAKNGIIKTLLGRVSKMKVSTKEEFAELQALITKYSDQLELKDNYETCSIMFDKIAELEQSGKAREEIFEMLPEETKQLAEYEFKFRDFMTLSPEKMLECMTDSSRDIYEDIIAGPFEIEYGSFIAQNIFPGINDKNIGFALSFHLTDKFAKTMMDRGWNPKLMSFEVIDLDYPTGFTFNVYEADGEDIKYLATFSDANEDCRLEEMRVCLATEKLKLLEENPILDASSVIMTGKSGGILAYNGKNDYSYINEFKEIFINNGDVGFFLSEAEQTQRLLKAAAERYQKMVEIKPGKIMMQSFEDRIKKLEEKRNSIKNQGKFTPLDVEEATEEVTLEKVKKILEEIGEPLRTRQESFEKGIGYNE